MINSRLKTTYRNSRRRPHLDMPNPKSDCRPLNRPSASSSGVSSACVYDKQYRHNNERLGKPRINPGNRRAMAVLIINRRRRFGTSFRIPFSKSSFASSNASTKVPMRMMRFKKLFKRAFVLRPRNCLFQRRLFRTPKGNGLLTFRGLLSRDVESLGSNFRSAEASGKEK